MQQVLQLARNVFTRLSLVALLLLNLTATRVVSAEGTRQNDPCGQGGPVVLQASSGTIYSPGYNGWTYDNNAYCSWLILAPPGNVR